MKCAAAKIVPKLGNFEEKQCHIDIAQGMLTTFNKNRDLLKKVITGEESWLYGYDIEIKTQSSPVEASRRAKTKKIRSSSAKCEGFAPCFLFLLAL